jgi:tellurite resistance protein TerC
MSRSAQEQEIELPMTTSVSLWIGFGLFVVMMMALDLGIIHRKPHKVSVREAAVWTAVWVSLGFVFDGVIYACLGRLPAVEFLTGFIIEWSLSMDNVFVFAVIFSCFAVPPQYQHSVLFWGIMGAVVLRLAFVLTGVVLLERFQWVIYPMGGFLVLTGIKLFLDRGKKLDVAKNPVLRVARRWLPVTDDYVGQEFFVRRDRAVVEPCSTGQNETGKRLFAHWMVTPLFLVLLVVETTDVAFAVDSIPAVFAVTHDPFIVFTSNIFAILGLRSLYFLLAATSDAFRYLSVGLAAILCFVGTKMLLSAVFPISIAVSLTVICGILSVAITASLLVRRLESGRIASRLCVDDEWDKGRHC